jgi:hypothetical protein
MPSIRGSLDQKIRNKYCGGFSGTQHQDLLHAALFEVKFRKKMATRFQLEKEKRKWKFMIMQHHHPPA